MSINSSDISTYKIIFSIIFISYFVLFSHQYNTKSVDLSSQTKLNLTKTNLNRNNEEDLIIGPSFMHNEVFKTINQGKSAILKDQPRTIVESKPNISDIQSNGSKTEHQRKTRSKRGHKSEVMSSDFMSHTGECSKKF